MGIKKGTLKITKKRQGRSVEKTDTDHRLISHPGKIILGGEIPKRLCIIHMKRISCKVKMNKRGGYRRRKAKW